MSSSTIETCLAHAPAGRVTGRRYDDGTERFHSIAYSLIDEDFSDARPNPDDADRNVDATVPQPANIALTVTRPTGTTPGADLPVIAYIHGGRFEHGTHEDPRADGAASAESGVMIVQIDYRISVQGLARFRDDEPHHYRAIDDCQLALEWVQRNIESFGGDPTNVTLFGQSAGATTALWLSRRDHYRGAFRRVLACSPCFPRHSWEQRKWLYRGMLGQPLTRESLNQQPKRRLARAYRRFRTALILDMALGPHPLDMAQMAEVDLVITSTRDEFYQMPFPALLDRFGLGPIGVRVMARVMGLTGSVSAWIEGAKTIDPDRIAGRLVGDSCVRRWSQYVADGAPGRVWMAEFTRTPERPALHSSEIRPLFAAGPYHRDSPVHGQLMDFARTGDPGWPEYHAETGRQAVKMALHDGTVTPVTDPLGYIREGFPEPYGKRRHRRDRQDRRGRRHRRGSRQ